MAGNQPTHQPNKPAICLHVFKLITNGTKDGVWSWSKFP